MSLTTKCSGEKSTYHKDNNPCVLKKGIIFIGLIPTRIYNKSISREKQRHDNGNTENVLVIPKSHVQKTISHT